MPRIYPARVLFLLFHSSEVTFHFHTIHSFFLYTSTQRAYFSLFFISFAFHLWLFLDSAFFFVYLASVYFSLSYYHHHPIFPGLGEMRLISTSPLSPSLTIIKRLSLGTNWWNNCVSLMHFWYSVCQCMEHLRKKIHLTS